MNMPEVGQQREANRESQKAPHRQRQLGESVRNLKRHDQKSHGKCEHCITESFQPGDFPAAPAEVRFRRNEQGANFFVKHGRYCATASITVDEGVVFPSSPSQRAITAVARQFPRTFVAVRAMSINWSMPKMIHTGHAGKWNESTVPTRITSIARGTPATPLLVSISVSTITSCWPKLK